MEQVNNLLVQVLYASDPSAPGAPLAGPSGSVPIGEKPPAEIIEQDGSFSSTVEFKQLGFIPTYLEKSGRVKALNGDTYQVCVSTALGMLLFKSFIPVSLFQSFP